MTSDGDWGVVGSKGVGSAEEVVASARYATVACGDGKNLRKPRMRTSSGDRRATTT